ncbi:DUF2157 domain-containing protein [Aquimarina mytili]|uniref:DUF2157 domain-containing protein n=1 Tax=Aquimarina mytili TaxID=874423 RepID=A0A936ZUP2_9FLAO|nr:DUF2157 domain-containing protein [Aquimarina mytili]MBL0682476.1 DUF2157 domain-containing protein [Aquimarina mytili]
MGSKFNKELQTLVKDKVISPELADKIEQYYATRDIGKPNKLFTVFGIFGALLIGSGVILMLAHNWDEFSRTIKTILAFLPLLVGQFLTGFSILKEKSKTWKEASATFLFFSVGACIALISQIYNIPGDLGVYLLTWVALCLPLIYLLRSNAVALLSILLSTYYALEIGLWRFRDNTTPWLYIVLFLTILPQYWRLIKTKINSNTLTIFNWAIPISITIALAAFIGTSDTLGFVMYITLFGVLYNIGRLPVFRDLKVFRNGSLIIGSLGTVICMLIFTFKWIWSEFPDNPNYNTHEWYMTLVLLAIALLVLGYSIWKKGWRATNLFQVTFVVFWIVYFLFSTFGALPVILMNILVFALGISAIKIGADKFDFKILNYGLLIISILIACRFFDTGMGFIVKGILFVLAGTGFFLTNYFMLKRQQKISKQLKDLQL